MRLFLTVLFLIISATFGYGLYMRAEDSATGEFCIGISIVGIFFVWMPLFIYHRWKNKSMKDYMLTKENLDKMREEGREKKL